MLNKTIFISDIHLCQSRPSITDAFIKFLDETASQCESLYILGDLFEYWVGDDCGQYENVIEVIKRLTDLQIKVFLMHGNRDFLIGSTFEKKTGALLLEDPTLIEIYDKRILLSHGDSLCIDDIDYQAFKIKIRNESWKKEFLKKTINERISIANEYRKESELNKKNKSDEIMDVNTSEVDRTLIRFNYPDFFIHGHTHRPKNHLIHINGHKIQRIVLGDWYKQGSYLAIDSSGTKAHAI